MLYRILSNLVKAVYRDAYLSVAAYCTGYCDALAKDDLGLGKEHVVEVGYFLFLDEKLLQKMIILHSYY